jgi:hypothetical protein
VTRPGNSALAAVAAWTTSVSTVTGRPATGGNVRDRMRVPWKLIGLAGLAGLVATGAVVMRAGRPPRRDAPEELRKRLHQRLADVSSGNGQRERLKTGR